MRADLLAESLLSADTCTGERRRFSLPALLAALERDELRAFSNLQAHQQHAWHAFLVQLAAIARHRAAEDGAAWSADRWQAALLAMTEGRREPWCLVVEDLSQPAFLQPPVPEGHLDGFKPLGSQPDQIDVLITSKNHDVKAARIASPAPEHWIYALVSLQTMEGYGGRGNYGISRMNGGFSSRPCVGVEPASSPGRHLRRDVRALLKGRGDLLELGFQDRGGRALLWLDGWDGATSDNLEDCDPFYIELCRRLRLTGSGDGQTIWFSPSDSPRLATKERLGNVGDPWIPVHIEKGSALTLTDPAGFTYAFIQELLFGDGWKLGAAGALGPEDAAGSSYLFRVLVRGQGQTDGYHERRLPVPSEVRSILSQPQGKARLGGLSRARVEATRRLQNKVLHPALCALLQGAPDALNIKDKRTDRWKSALDRAVDACFFEHLWADLELEPTEAAHRWSRVLHPLGRAQLDAAIASAPVPSVRRWRCIATAEQIYEGSFRRQFPEFTATEEA